MFLPMSYASQDIVGSDYNYGTQLGISEVLYKDTSEQDPNYDYYAIKALISDVMFQNDFWTSPLLAYVRIAVPLWAGEPPGSHQPQAGFYWGQSPVNFGFQGISFSIQLPAYSVSYSTSTDDNFRYFDWTVIGVNYWFIFEDYAEFSVGIRIPQGYLPGVWVGGEVVWFTNYGLIFTYHSQEDYWWLHVPNSRDTTFGPKQIPTIPAFPEIPLTIPIKPAIKTQSFDQMISMP